MLKKNLLLLLMLMGLKTWAQEEIMLVALGDSSIYLININDSLCYISFTDPDNINQYISFNRNLDPLRSHMVCQYHVKYDSLILTQTYEVFYLNKSVKYFTNAHTKTGTIKLGFEGYNITESDYLNTFDSLLLEVNDSCYLLDLNTSIYSKDIPKPTSSIFKVSIYDSHNRFKINAIAKPNETQNTILFSVEQLSGSYHSVTHQSYLKQHLPKSIIIDNQRYFLKIEYIDNRSLYWQND
jgi:hypothetical protein